jgi:hypothetical protein
VTWHGYTKAEAICILGQASANIAEISTTQRLTTPGNIFFKLSAAQAAFGLPPFKLSSNTNRGCRTGFEKETRAESTKVMFRTPHACHVVEQCLLAFFVRYHSPSKFVRHSIPKCQHPTTDTSYWQPFRDPGKEEYAIALISSSNQLLGLQVCVGNY